MSDASIPASALMPVAPSDLPTARKFLIFSVMAFGMFLALIDIQIVAASLNDVQAGLSAGPDEISWVQTSYLIAELVMIPFSAFLTQALSTRWLFSASAALFTLSSIGCGLAWNIESMIFFRALQGFTGGAMVPTVFSTGFTLFKGKQQALIPAILGMVSVLAPTLGPTVGGVVTQWLDWRWIFFINIIPGILVATGAVLFIHVDKADFPMLKRIDWVHLLSMAVALGCLEYVLEEGPRKNWFSDPQIQVSAWFSLVAFVLFLERSFYSKNPIVRLTPFRDPTFTFACVFNLVIGFGLYASTYLTPVFLGRIRDFDSLQIGTTVFVVGIGQFFSTILAAKLIGVVDRRILVAVGLLGFSLSMWLTSAVTTQWGADQFLWPQIIRGLFIMLCIVPSVNMALTAFQGPELRYASGLFNLMRNLGGAIGIATVNTWLQDWTRTHTAHFGETLGHSGREAQEVIAAVAARFSQITPDVQHALMMAKSVFGATVAADAFTLAFNDVFMLMSWMFLAALLMVPFCRK